MGLIVGLFPAQDGLEVQLKNQSIRFGQPDPSTSESALRLRVGEPDGYVVFGIDWQEIAQIRYKSAEWTPDNFAALRGELAQTHRDSSNSRPATGQSTRIDGPSPSAVRPLWQPPERPGPTESPSLRVQFIELDAVAANWDRDPEWDGLVVRVWPMDQWGRVIRTPATLTVNLFGESNYGGSYASDRLGQWVRAVHAADYGSDGASFRLEFQNFDPERWDAVGYPDRWIDPHGTVVASLAAPGHGVFQASTITPVRLRRFSPLRDRLFIRSRTHRLSIDP
jgi:hypothetical protein